MVMKMLPDARRGPPVGQHGHGQQQHVAQHVLVGDRHAEPERQDLPGSPQAARQHGPDHGAEERHIAPTLDRNPARQLTWRQDGLAAPVPAIEPVKQREQEDGGEPHRGRHGAERPAEADAAQEAEEQRRVA